MENDPMFMDRDERGGRGGRGGRRGGGRKKVCRVLAEQGVFVDYKDVKLLKHFISETGKIVPRRISGTTAKQQRDVAQAIRRARILALLPFVSESG
ncbi:30S ribosomal protein S18 [Myxococcota bacterium]|nr:30S ribosomal protein S18 [Myxococcota bacterium]